MKTLLIANICVGLSVAFFLAARLLELRMKKREPEPPAIWRIEAPQELFIGWRITGTGNVPETIALDLNTAGEAYIRGGGEISWED